MPTRAELTIDGDLRVQLDAYAATVSANTRNWKERMRDWLPYAAAVGSGLALTTAADAGIIYSGPQNLTLSIPFGTRKIYFYGSRGTQTIKSSGGQAQKIAPLQMNVGGAQAGSRINLNLFFLHTEIFPFMTSHTYRLVSVSAPKGGLLTNRLLMGDGHGLKRLNSGQKISAGAGPFSAHGVLAIASNLRERYGSISGTWFTRPFNANNLEGFAGVRFTQGGQTHYGWIRLETTIPNGRGPLVLKAIDWAYNDVPDAPINAGAIPEPSSMALALLAAGSLGVLAWRRRRQALANAAPDTGSTQA